MAAPTPAPGAAGPADVDVAVIVVTYRCRDHVVTCLEALRPALAAHSSHIVVVDNDSGDGTVALLRARFPEVQVIAMGRNAGFARACNRGIGATRSRHIVLLNPDTVPAPGAVDALVDFADATPGTGVVGPGLRNTDGSDQGTARAFPTAAAALFGRRSPLTRALPRNRWSARYLTGLRHTGDGPFVVDWLSGACLLVPRTVVDDVGALDESFFLYWEDADWCRRIKAAGYGVWCVPTARVTHAEGGSRGHAWPAAAVRHFHTGAYRYWAKHHAPQPWNPARGLAAAALTTRAAAVIAINAAGARRRRPRGAA
jgi:GT2 family glycosyltransferase